MIRLDRCRWKNFLSYGNSWTDYFFQPGITRIYGVNGQGKSVIIDALHYVLFGKPYRKINIPQLINTINKTDLAVELEFSIGEDKYKISRGMRPNIFEIYKNDDIIPQPSHNRSYQTILTEDILHFNENIFNQTVVKSSTRKISFLTLSKGEKRKIVETILNIEIFSLMRELSKVQIGELKTSMSMLKKDISSTKLMIEQELGNIEKLRNIQRQIEEENRESQKIRDDRLTKIDEMLRKIEEGYDRLGKYKIELDQKAEELKQSKLKISQLKKSIQDEEVNLGFITKKMAMFEEHCHGCEKVELMKKSSGKEDKQERLAKLQVKMIKEKKNRDQASERIDKIRKMLLNRKVLDLEKVKQENDRERITSKQLGKVEVDVDETRYLDLEKQKKEYERKYNETGVLSNHYQIVRDLMSDDGIRTFVIQKYLPYINKLLNAYLVKFDAEINFNFDVEFNEVVGSRYKETYTYNSFSEGQKRRIDLAILFTFLEFCKIKNQKSDVNVLLLDEITGGLDAVGENALYDILREIADKEKKEIITISHSLGIEEDKIDHFYQIIVEKGFSTIKKIEGESNG